MTRPEITAELSTMIEKKINPNNDPRIYWAKEVTFDYSTNYAVRVDYMKFVPVNNSVADKDEMMILDTAGKANKRLGLSALSDWIIGKIADKVFENLQTQNKTILGALNELNSKTSIQYINNVLPDSLRTGLYAGIYDVGSENAPSDYGMVMYLSYTYDTNKWYTAIASATNNEGVFVSTKTNGADWNGWRKLSTN